MKLRYGPYSPSRLETALCGRAFFLTYIEPRDTQPKTESVAAARGSVVHEVFEKMTQRMADAVGAGQQPVFTPDELREWIVAGMQRHPAATSETAEIIEMVKRYIERPPRTLTSDAGIEMRFGVKPGPNGFVECDYDDPDALGRARADILMISDDTTKALIYDHKTQPNEEEADTFQMGFYAWAVSKIHPYLEEIHTVLHFARRGTYSQPYVWTKDDLARVEDEILTRIQIVETRQDWAPTPNKQCIYCPFVGDCPVVQSRGPIPAVIETTQQAVTIAGEVRVLGERLSRLKKVLRAFVEATGPVAIPGIIYRIDSKDAIHWDAVNKKELKDKTIAIFKKHGVEASDYMAFGQEASMSVWLLGNKPLVEELSAFLPRKVSTKFDGYKA